LAQEDGVELPVPVEAAALVVVVEPVPLVVVLVPQVEVLVCADVVLALLVGVDFVQEPVVVEVEVEALWGALLVVLGTELVVELVAGFEVQEGQVDVVEWCALVTEGEVVVVTTLVVGWTGAEVVWVGMAIVTM
jgi:hypothetical protein